MQPADINTILSEVREALLREDWERAVALVEALRPPDQADVFSELPEDVQDELLPRLDPEDSADILEELDDDEAAAIAERLETDELVRIVDRMEPDEAADLLGDIPPEQVVKTLDGIEDAEDIVPLLSHRDDTAGGLMTAAEVVLHVDITVREALEYLRRLAPESEAVYYLFVVDDDVRLVGVVSLRQLVVTPPDTYIKNILDREVIYIEAGADQEEAARLMARYDLLALPVVDQDMHLLGVITHDDLVDVLEDEMTEDIQRMGGAQPLKQAYLSSSVVTVTRSRVSWLLLLFLTESLTGTVLRHFEEELKAVVALAFFVPLLIGTGGNAGSQTTSTIIRAIAVGDIDLRDGLRSLWHELRIGLLLGLAMGVIGYLRAVLWGSSPGLALTVAVAVFSIVVWANGLGAVLPLLAIRFGIDPTVVSGPVMSTLVDATGLFIYFTIAQIIMGI